MFKHTKVAALLLLLSMKLNFTETNNKVDYITRQLTSAGYRIRLKGGTSMPCGSYDQMTSSTWDYFRDQNSVLSKRAN